MPPSSHSPFNHQPSTIPPTLTPRAGLTLVEVLMALAILGISAAVLMTATSRCLAIVSLSKNYYEARRVLELGEIEYPILVYKDTEAAAAVSTAPGAKPGTRPGPSSINSANPEKIINPTVGPVEYPNGFTFTRSCKRSETHEDLLEVQTRVTWSMRGKDAFEQVTSYLYFTNDITL